MSTWVWTGWVVEPSNRAVQVYRGVDAVQTLEEGGFVGRFFDWRSPRSK